jgi:hypothetical protein
LIRGMSHILHVKYYLLYRIMDRSGRKGEKVRLIAHRALPRRRNWFHRKRRQGLINSIFIE